MAITTLVDDRIRQRFSSSSSLDSWFAFFAEALSRPRGMVRQVKFVCADAASVEAVGKAILAAHYSEEDVDAAARKVAQPLIDAGSCTHFAKHVDVLLQRVIKWLSPEMAVWEVENVDGRIRYALSLPVMDHISRTGKALRTVASPAVPYRERNVRDSGGQAQAFGVNPQDRFVVGHLACAARGTQSLSGCRTKQGG